MMMEGKYFVEQCDVFSTHFDHDILGWFDDLEKAREFADKKASTAFYFYIYRVFEPDKNVTIFELCSNCVYEAKGQITRI